MHKIVILEGAPHLCTFQFESDYQPPKGLPALLTSQSNIGAGSSPVHEGKRNFLLQVNHQHEYNRYFIILLII